MHQHSAPKDVPRYLKNVVRRAAGRADEYAYTNVDGTRVSLGRYGDPAGYARWERIRDDWLIARNLEEAVTPSRVPVAELASRWLDYEKARADDGLIHPKTYMAGKSIVEALLAEHAQVLITSFGPRSMKEIQTRLRATRCRSNRGRYRQAQDAPTLSRSEINRRINGIRRLFRWGVSEELVPPAVLSALEALPGLRVGEARDNPPRNAAAPEDVRATIARLRADGHHGHAGIIELIRWTGCRPDEICSLTWNDVVKTPDGLELHLHEHKTRKKTGTARIVPLNKQAARIVEDARNTCLSLDGARQLFLNAHGQTISPNGLFQAVRRAANAAGVQRWTAYQLRHLAATEMLDAGSTEVEAAAMLGHTPNSLVVRRYSRDRTRLARRAAAGIGSREAG